MAQATLPIKELYKSIVPTMQERHGYSNVMAVPKVEKIVLNMGVGRRAKIRRSSCGLPRSCLRSPFNGL